MTLTELEKFYQLGNIEGLAFISPEGSLIEDQLILSTAGATLMAKSFYKVHKGLAAAGRPCKGFLIRIGEHQFISLPLPDGIVILQLDPKESVDEYFKQALKMASYQQSAGASPQVLLQGGQRTETVQSAKPGLSVVDEGLTLTWEDFQSSLTRALSRVAPSNLVKTLVQQAIEESGLTEGEVPSLEQMSLIGHKAVELVPNKGRRKMVSKELQIVFENLGLS